MLRISRDNMESSSQNLRLLLALTAFFSVSIEATETLPGIPRLFHDPFKKPEKLLPAPQGQVVLKKDENLFQTSSKLTATLLAGENSMVLVNGQALKLGEIIDGYQLLEVKEHSAVFTKDRQHHILEIDNVDKIN
jgi:hypothetical protein